MQLIKTLLKSIITVVLIFFALFGYGFCFDSGMGFMNFLLALFNFSIFGFLICIVWHTEVSRYIKSHSKGQIASAIFKILIALTLIIFLTMFVEW